MKCQTFTLLYVHFHNCINKQQRGPKTLKTKSTCEEEIEKVKTDLQLLHLSEITFRLDQFTITKHQKKNVLKISQAFIVDVYVAI